MSPGNQMRALTANKAIENSNTIKAGKTVDRKKDTYLKRWAHHFDLAYGEAAAPLHRRPQDLPSRWIADAAKTHLYRSGRRKERRRPGQTDAT